MSKRFTTVGLVLALAATILGTAGCSLKTVTAHREDSKPTRSGTVRSFDLAGYQALRVNIPDKPLATVGSSLPDVDLELYAVQRTGKAVAVVIAVDNTGDQSFATYEIGGPLDEDPNTADKTLVTSNISVVDSRGLKEYRSFVDPDDPNTCLCSVSSTGNTMFSRVESGARVYFAAEDAAPPSSVSKVDVRTGLGTFANVKLER